MMKFNARELLHLGGFGILARSVNILAVDNKRSSPGNPGFTQEALCPAPTHIAWNMSLHQPNTLETLNPIATRLRTRYSLVIQDKSKPLQSLGLEKVRLFLD